MTQLLAVTCRAAVAYLERIRQVDMDALRRALTRSGRAPTDAALLTACGTSAQRLAPLIATPEAESMIGPTVKRIILPDMTLLIGHATGKPVVRSVLAGGYRTPKRPRPSHAEARP